jgi:hypothetical protein
VCRPSPVRTRPPLRPFLKLQVCSRIRNRLKFACHPSPRTPLASVDGQIQNFLWRAIFCCKVNSPNFLILRPKHRPHPGNKHRCKGRDPPYVDYPVSPFFLIRLAHVADRNVRRDWRTAGPASITVLIVLHTGQSRALAPISEPQSAHLREPARASRMLLGIRIYKARRCLYGVKRRGMRKLLLRPRSDPRDCPQLGKSGDNHECEYTKTGGGEAPPCFDC